MDLLISLTLALALCLAAPALPAAAQTQPPAVLAQAELTQTVQRYADAWASRDADKIAALHSADCVFHLFVEGSQAASGKGAVQAQFQKILSDNPGYASTVRSINSGHGSVVIEYDINMDPPTAFTLGSFRYVPNGRPYSVPAIDMIWFSDGLMTAKHTYLDTGVVRENSHSAEKIEVAE
jgi:steroid delta-isomerase-like uncharacterized protein